MVGAYLLKGKDFSARRKGGEAALHKQVQPFRCNADSSGDERRMECSGPCVGLYTVVMRCGLIGRGVGTRPAQLLLYLLTAMLVAACGRGRSTAASQATQTPYVGVTAGPAAGFYLVSVTAGLYPVDSSCDLSTGSGKAACRTALQTLGAVQNIPLNSLPESLGLPHKVLVSPVISHTEAEALSEGFLRSSALNEFGIEQNATALLQHLYSGSYVAHAPIFQLWGEYYQVVAVPHCVLPDAWRLAVLPQADAVQLVGKGAASRMPEFDKQVPVIVATYSACEGILVRPEAGGTTSRYGTLHGNASVVYFGSMANEPPFAPLFVVSGEAPCGAKAVAAACA